MAEFTEAPRIVMGEGHFAAAHQIGEQALFAMRVCNGNLAYHGSNERIGHAPFVAEGTNKVLRLVGASRAAQAVGDVAAKMHDLVSVGPRGIIERQSADALLGQFAAHGLPTEAAEAGELAILGTEPIIENGKILGQMATRLAYHSKEAEQIAHAVASADMGGEWYHPLGMYRTHLYYQELHGVAPGGTPPFEGFLAFQRNNTALLDGYEFPCAAGERALGALRGAVVAENEQLVMALERGDVSSWEQVVARDLAFAQRHGYDISAIA